MMSPRAVSAGRQGGPAEGRSWPTAGQVFAAARMGCRPVAAYVGTGCVGPPRTVRRARGTVARALRRPPPRPRSPAAFASSRSQISVSACVRRISTVDHNPTYCACPSRSCRVSASVRQTPHYAHPRHVSARRAPPPRPQPSRRRSNRDCSGLSCPPGEVGVYLRTQCGCAPEPGCGGSGGVCGGNCPTGVPTEGCHYDTFNFCCLCGGP